MDTNKFVNRHVGISAEDIPSMLQAIGVKSVDELIDQTIPSDIRLKEPLNLPEPMTEREFAEHISELASKNEVFTSYIGMGWYDTVCPAPIQRNVFENPVWYTSYTPYQAEVSQGRLEALLNFQTVIAELTGLPLANCSLLDEATAAAEAATTRRNFRLTGIYNVSFFFFPVSNATSSRAAKTGLSCGKLKAANPYEQTLNASDSPGWKIIWPSCPRLKEPNRPKDNLFSSCKAAFISSTSSSSINCAFR